MSNIDADDLIFYTDKDNEIYSGGYSVKSIMLKNNMSPIVTLNDNVVALNKPQKGGSLESLNKVSDLFDNLVVPNWSIAYTNKNMNIGMFGGANDFEEYNSSSAFLNMGNKTNDNNDSDYNDESDYNDDNNENDDVIDNDLYNKLLDLAKNNENTSMKGGKNKSRHNKFKLVTNKRKTKKHK